MATSISHRRRITLDILANRAHSCSEYSCAIENSAINRGCISSPQISYGDTVRQVMAINTHLSPKHD